MDTSAFDDLVKRAHADDAVRGLFGAVQRLARIRGHGDVLDSWGDDLSLLRHQPRI